MSESLNILKAWHAMVAAQTAIIESLSTEVATRQSVIADVATRDGTIKQLEDKVTKLNIDLETERKRRLEGEKASK